MNRRAVLSQCETYRYALTREGWMGGEGTVLFVMLNPSTADAYIDDRTIRRCIGFAQSWGYARLTVANLYAYRATDPSELVEAQRAGVDPIGPENDDWLHLLADEAVSVVVAWGAKASPERERAVLEILRPRPVCCLGQTQSGAPKHPLYLRADEPRVEFEPIARPA